MNSMPRSFLSDDNHDEFNWIHGNSNAKSDFD
jgi:hypothetical protein